MDLLDFEGQDLYFDEHPDARAAGLIAGAAQGILGQQAARGAQHFFQCFAVAVGFGIADKRRDRL